MKGRSRGSTRRCLYEQRADSQAASRVQHHSQCLTNKDKKNKQKINKKPTPCSADTQSLESRGLQLNLEELDQVVCKTRRFYIGTIYFFLPNPPALCKRRSGQRASEIPPARASSLFFLLKTTWESVKKASENLINLPALRQPGLPGVVVQEEEAVPFNQWE